MKAIPKLIVSAFVLSLATPYVYAADSEVSKAYKTCIKEAESDEDEPNDMRTFVRGCMLGSGINAADADTILNELGPPANKDGAKDES